VPIEITVVIDFFNLDTQPAGTLPDRRAPGADEQAIHLLLR
jgi:hypothetical protein